MEASRQPITLLGSRRLLIVVGCRREAAPAETSRLPKESLSIESIEPWGCETAKNAAAKTVTAYNEQNTVFILNNIRADIY